MACRGNIGEVRQILRIGDIGRGICLSAFEALPRIRLAGCTRHVIAVRPASSKQMTRHTNTLPGEASRSLSAKGEESGMRAARALARWSAG